MSTRDQVILGDEEKEHFRHQAEAEGVSLSSRLREAGERALRTARRSGTPRTPAELRIFFETCVARESATGEPEPDWEEHLAAIAASRRSGQAAG